MYGVCTQMVLLQKNVFFTLKTVFTFSFYVFSCCISTECFPVLYRAIFSDVKGTHVTVLFPCLFVKCCFQISQKLCRQKVAQYEQKPYDEHTIQKTIAHATAVARSACTPAA